MKNDSTQITIGMDLGDKHNHICVLTGGGEDISEHRIANTPAAVAEFFGGFESPDRVTVAIETGTHSPWVCHVLQDMGLNVLVANARKTSLIYDATVKTDTRDARMLARMARFEPELLFPIQPRDRQAQAHLAVLRARNGLVKSRTQLITMVRGLVKSSGGRLPACSAPSFHTKVGKQVPTELRPAIDPVLDAIATLTARIGDFGRQVRNLCRSMPETERVMQVAGVGPLTALTFVLTVENPQRFVHNRDIGPYLGLTPGKDQSGDSDVPKSITKAGDGRLRHLLVEAASYILGPFGPDCDLKRHGTKIAERGGKVAKKKARVAVARKLAVMLLSLWKTGSDYEPNRKRRTANDPITA
jgi:transposase